MIKDLENSEIEKKEIKMSCKGILNPKEVNILQRRLWRAENCVGMVVNGCEKKNRGWW